LVEGGSRIANPDGSWLVEPLAHEEQIIFADCAHQRVREEQQNFDPMGHYARRGMLQLNLSGARQQSVHFSECYRPQYGYFGTHGRLHSTSIVLICPSI